MWIDKFVWSKLWRAACRQTDRQTGVTWTDKSLKAEGPKILSNDIFYLQTVIVGCPIFNNPAIKVIFLKVKWVIIIREFYLNFIALGAVSTEATLWRTNLKFCYLLASKCKLIRKVKFFSPLLLLKLTDNWY